MCRPLSIRATHLRRVCLGKMGEKKQREREKGEEDPVDHVSPLPFPAIYS